MFYVLRQKQSCSHGVKDGCKSLQRFSFKLLKPFCLCLNKALIYVIAAQGITSTRFSNEKISSYGRHTYNVFYRDNL